MGLRMDDIHTPTVPSGPTTGQRAVNGIEKDKLSLMDLIAEKTRVEEELSALGSVLDSVLRCPLYMVKKENADRSTLQHGVTMSTSLTTFDGFPRNDLDIAQSV